MLQDYCYLIMFLQDLAREERNDTGAKASEFSRTLWKIDRYFLLNLLTPAVSRLEAPSRVAETSIDIQLSRKNYEGTEGK